ncbi:MULTISPECIES: aspartate aminotransferase family protein [Rubrivivax]|uniref:Aspartate aminotransferase family protein n=1 Tax=Rubrivivax benzoatilyticus TaxID=316997 RepID=A0ABX0HXC4_9BURK|nr:MULTISPECIES: aspartate aminotransferase family protein [Rubrivivax]EGJ10374.1 putative aminotransferase [Rubrivivax benzoatilyticus JA2 = ATCC BAA-35]MCC9646291.1 aspartate aminotransferase family protein [Rubrivivax sp. JA1029]NHK98434.1 aspartate aminotransferase family protein [Rubrivivax benzoatilyticus]NHL23791.1 aspartate aminotransferase family protein [Rubrivivax benzoatilyticus]
MSTQRTTREWQAADAAHFLHPFTDFQALSRKGARVIERAENIYLWDTEGHKILDAMSGLWCVNVGYGQQALVDAATAQLKQLPFYNAFFQTATPPAIELAELLAEVTPPQFQHVFFSGSGSEGNDTVVRMVRRYWDLLGQPERQVIISRDNAYHGSTMAGASLGGMSGMHAQGGLPIPGIVHIGQPYWHEHGKGLSRDEFGLVAARWLEAKILELGPERVAAFIGEPIQGAGGVIIPPATYWPEVQRICDQYGILLVSDEVICGFGRTGRWFGCETMGTRPDLMTFAKGVTSGYVPLGGVMVGERIAKVLIEKGGEFNHGYTYSGHPVACAVALANIKLMRELKLVEHVRDDVGPYLASQFATLRDHPLVADAESCGLMGAILLAKDKATGTPFPESVEIGMVCRGHCFREGLIMRAVGDRMIIAPPLVITRQQIDEMMGLIRRCLDLTLADAKAGGWLS